MMHHTLTYFPKEFDQGELKHYKYLISKGSTKKIRLQELEAVHKTTQEHPSEDNN